MIDSWHISNFKSIRRPVELSLAPLTVFSGPNSSGKSAFIQSILMVSQSLDSSAWEEPLVLNGRFVRLGRLEDVLHRRCEQKEIEIGFTIGCITNGQISAVALIKGYKARERGRANRLSARVESCKVQIEEDSSRKRIELVRNPVELQSEELDRSGSAIQDQICKGLFDYDIVHPKRAELSSEQIIEEPLSASTSNFLPGQILMRVHPHIRYLTRGLQHLADAFLHLSGELGTYAMHIDWDYALSETTIQRAFGRVRDRLSGKDKYVRAVHEISGWQGQHTVRECVEFFEEQGVHGGKLGDLSRRLRGVIPELQESPTPRRQIGRVKTYFKEKGFGFLEVEGREDDIFFHISDVKRRDAVHVDGHLEYSLREESRGPRAVNLQEVNPKTYEASKLEYEKTRLEVVKFPADYNQIISRIGQVLGARVYYLGPLRDDPRAIHAIPPLPNQRDVGLKGEYTAAVLDIHGNREVEYPLPPNKSESFEGRYEHKQGRLIDAIEIWLGRMGLAETLGTTEKPKVGYHLDVRPTGLKRGLDLTSIGVGVSQVLPILVMGLLAPQDSTLILEQPEVHLHPKVQSILGDFFLGIIQCGKQCIVETHSEYLINRLRRRVAESPGTQMLDQLNIYFVERENSVSHFRAVKPNEYGAILEWPKGFFDEVEEESSAILEASMEKRRQNQ